MARYRIRKTAWRLFWSLRDKRKQMTKSAKDRLEGLPQRTKRVCGSDQIRLRFTKNYKVADIIDYWNKDVDTFKAKSAKYYLYK